LRAHRAAASGRAAVVRGWADWPATSCRS
jgi:hypothetical protein